MHRWFIAILGNTLYTLIPLYMVTTLSDFCSILCLLSLFKVVIKFELCTHMMLLTTPIIFTNLQISFSYNLILKRFYPGLQQALKTFKVSGVMDLSPAIRALLHKENKSLEAIMLKKAMAYTLFYYSFHMFKIPINTENQLFNRIGSFYTQRPFMDKPLIAFPQTHSHGLKMAMPFHQNLIATTFAGYQISYESLLHTGTSLDTTSYKGTKLLPITLYGEIFLMEKALGSLLKSNPKIKGFLVDSDNNMNTKLKTLTYAIMKQPNPDGYLKCLYNTDNDKIVPFDVKLFQEPEKSLSCVKGYITVSPYLDKVFLMKRYPGDIGTIIAQVLKKDPKLSRELEQVEAWHKALKNINAIKDKDISIEDRYAKFLKTNEEYLYNPIVQSLIPSTFLDTIPQLEFNAYISALTKEEFSKHIDDISNTIDDNILFPLNATVNTAEFENQIIKIFKQLPKTIQQDVIENYYKAKTLLIE